MPVQVLTHWKLSGSKSWYIKLNDQASNIIGLIKSSGVTVSFTTYFTVSSEFNFTYQIPDVITCVFTFVLKTEKGKGKLTVA